MRNMSPSASLVPTGNTLKIVGQGPIAANFTKDMVRRLFKMPAHPTEFYGFGANAGISAAEVMPRLTKQAYDSFLKVVDSDPQLTAQHEAKKRDFAAFAHPTTAKWPPCDGLMVLEAVMIDLPFILNLIWMLDGSFWLDYLDGAETIRMSAVEFESGYGSSIRDYCEAQLPIKMDACQRAITLLAAEAPKKAVVSFINRRSEVEKKTMFFWQPDQVELYLRRHKLSHIATDTE